VVCPVVALCTSTDVPLMAAIVPDAPGNWRAAPDPPAPAAGLPPPLPVVEDVVEAEDEGPHAARETAATPSADKARALRTVPVCMARRRPAAPG
jgi:hypothetical protein